MNRRSSHRWPVWLLPLLLLRAFVPAGFMVSYEGDGLQLVFCEGVATAADSAHEEVHAHHAGSHDAPVGESAPADAHYAPCPFSLVASTAPHSIPYLAPEGLAPSDEEITLEPVHGASVGPIRSDRIRGPPHLS